MKLKIALACLIIVLFLPKISAQEFTRLDSIKGSITPQREWWDLNHYDLNVTVDPAQKFISGTNTVTYTVLKPYQTIQIDLQQPMQLLSATQNGEELTYTKEGSAYFISLKAKQEKGSVQKLDISFEGTPRVAVNPPWDGGWTWQEDSKGNVFAANSNEGIGPSIWWPNKDHPTEEPDSITMNITLDSSLVCVMNGKLAEQDFCDDIYIQPAASDNGVSLGAALLFAKENGCLKQKKMDHMYWGPSYTNDEIEKSIQLAKLNYSFNDNVLNASNIFFSESNSENTISCGLFLLYITFKGIPNR